MRTLVILAFATACYGGRYEVEPQSTDNECSTLDCPLLAGGEVRARAVFLSDITELLRVARVRVSPPELAEAYLEGDYIVIHPAAIAEGTESSATAGVLEVELADGATFERTFSVGAHATTSLIPDPERVPFDALPERRLPGARLALFVDDGVVVMAQHRAVDGTRLLGHAGDAWNGDAVEVTEVDDTWNDTADRQLIRRVRATIVGPGSVSLGAASLPIDTVTASTTARIELAESGAIVDPSSELRTPAGQFTRVSLIAYASDGRFIYGGPPTLPLEVISSDLSIAGMDRHVLADREIRLAGYRPGTATLTFRFDGHSIDVPVTVY
jgi:hypothetical protein